MALPKSVGNVRLNGTNIHNNSNIAVNYFDDPNDMNIMLDAIKKHTGLTGMDTFKKHEVKFSRLPLPACDVFLFRSDDYYRI